MAVVCKYKSKYYDLESNGFNDFKCPYPAINNEYCIFHDPNYWKDHEYEVREEFYKLVESAIKNEEPLYCIGFHLPDFDINDLKKRGLVIEFKRPVYFIGASFNTADFSEASFNEADFKGATFNTANFEEAIFNERANFYGAIFNIANFNRAKLNIANFYEASFNKTVDFFGASFNQADFFRASFSNTADFSVSKFKIANLSEATFKEAYFTKATFNTANFKGAIFFYTANFYEAIFKERANFKEAIFNQADFFKASFNEADFSKAKFFGAANFSKATFKNTADFTYTDFKDEVEFLSTQFNSPSQSKVDHIPVKFDYATFRKRVRFVGEANSPLSLEWVSLKGVDLTNVEFHNVIWREKKEFLGMIKRQAIIDEEFMSKNKNYEEVSKIYNLLRKNYESRLLFNEASNFFIGEMEAIRKRLWNGSIGDKIRSIPHILYKYIAMYGESYFLPLAFWTPIIMIIFTVLRIIMATSDLDIYNKFIDSLAAYFQVPRSNQDIDIIERLISAPILGSAFIALRRKFERRK